MNRKRKNTNIIEHATLDKCKPFKKRRKYKRVNKSKENKVDAKFCIDSVYNNYKFLF